MNIDTYETVYSQPTIRLHTSNQVKSNQIKSNQIKSNQPIIVRVGDTQTTDTRITSVHQRH